MPLVQQLPLDALQPVEPNGRRPLQQVARGGGARGRVALPDVLAGAVQATQQVLEMRGKRFVALGAAQAARLAEVLERAAAGGTAQPVGRRGEDVGAPLPHRLDEAAQGGLEDRLARLEPFLLRAVLAQVERHFRVVLHFGEVDLHLALFAVVAQHQGIASTEPTPASRPSSSIMIRSARPPSCRLCVTTTPAVSYSRATRKNTSCNRSELA